MSSMKRHLRPAGPGVRRIIVVIAAVTILLVGWKVSRPIPRLARAAHKLDHRVVDGRLSGFEYAILITARGSESASPALLRLRGIAGEVIETSAHSTDAGVVHARGVAQLVAGDAAGAVRTLDELARYVKSNATYWNDLAVAELQLARQDDDDATLAAALAAADRALEIMPATEEARFNRALALKRLGLSQASSRAYENYLEIDSTSEWAREADENHRELTPAISAVGWQELRGQLARDISTGAQTAFLNTVCSHTQLSRSLGENLALSAFGEAWLQGRTELYDRELTFARAVGTALVRCNGESMLNDAVGVIDRAIFVHDKAAVGILASSHAEYGRARLANAKRDVSASEAMFTALQQRFTVGGSPMSFVAEYFRANNLVDKGQSAAAADIGKLLLTRLPPRYPALRAQTLWLRGTALGSLGLVYESLGAYDEARLLFRQIGERANEMQIALMEANELTILGRDKDAWRFRRAAAAYASDVGDNALLEATLGGAARNEMLQGHWDIARSCVDVCLAAKRSTNQSRRVDALERRALANDHLDNANAASNDLARARLAATAIDPVLRQAALADIDSTEAIIARLRQPARSVELSTRAITFAVAHERTLDLPHLYFERAAAYAQLGRKSDRLADLHQTVDLLDERGKRVEQVAIRDSFLGSSAETYNELTAALWDDHDYPSAFLVSERARGRTLLDRIGAGAKTPPLSQLAVQKALPDGVLLLHYTSLPDRLLIIGLTRNEESTCTVRVSRERLRRDAEEFGESVEHSRAGSRMLGMELFRLLVGLSVPDISAYKRVIFVPDDVLMAIPFAALVEPNKGRFLIEKTEVTIAPSASIYVTLANQYDRPLRSSLIVGDADFDSSQHPDLPPLPGAAQEVRGLTRLYPTSVVLTKSHATPSEVLRLIDKADVLHIAAHVIVVAREPALSAILLARGQDDDGLLYLHQLTDQPRRKGGIAVLAGCRTAAAAGRGTIDNFAFAFLATGYSTVVGTLWNVDDKTSQEMSIHFHQLLRRGLAPSTALREAQLEMLRSSEPSLREPRSWSAYQIFGS